MFFGAPLSVVLELANDHVFGRGNHDGFALDLQASSPSEAPCVQRILAGEIDVGLEAGLMVNDVEVSSLFPRRLQQDLLLGRAVELLQRKNLRESGDLLAVEDDDDVHVVGQAGLTVNDGS